MKKILVAIAFLGFIACESKKTKPLAEQPKKDSVKVEGKSDSTQNNQSLKEEAPKSDKK